MTEAATDREDTTAALSALERRVDRLADKVETLTALVGRLHADSREALALSYAACESDVRLVVVLRTLLSVVANRGQFFPENLKFSEIIEQADADLRMADTEIERSVATFLAAAKGPDAQ